MREIKFRYIFKDKYSSKIELVYISQKNIEKIISTSDWQDIPELNSIRKYFDQPLLWEVVSRNLYTGFPSNSGQDIYEGDIVQLSNQQVIQGDDVGMRTILWLEDQGQFNWVHPFTQKTMSGWSFTKGAAKKYCEVIGNIYQNPELMEKI